jgi:hypothetical protein
MPSPTRAVQLGFVDLGEDSLPVEGKTYKIIPASSNKLGGIKYPDSQYKKLNLDLTAFYCEDLPDVFGSNEGLFKASINTRNPQDLDAMADISFVSKFSVKDKCPAPGFLYRAIFRNVIFQDFINFDFQLYELDTDSEVYYEKIKTILDSVPEIKSLNVLSGIPYLSLATKLFDGIVKTFGKNPDDQVWGEIPTLDVEPTPGGAFLRSGIYVIFEAKNKKGTKVDHSSLAYKDGEISVFFKIVVA